MIPPAVEPRWFLGLRFTPYDLETAARMIAARDPAPFAYVVTPNAQWIVGLDGGDRRYAAAAEKAWLVLNDSRILRLLSLRLWGRDFPVAAGSDLTAEVFARHITPADALTIIGGSEEVERRLRDQFGVRRIARYDPPMGFGKDPAEIERCAVFIRDNPARYVFIAVGAPQSDLVGRRTVEIGGAVGTAMCVGGSLNFLTGIIPRAPRFWRENSLEWLYRLMQNPRGHFRRVFVQSGPVVWVALKARLDPHRHGGP